MYTFVTKVTKIFLVLRETHPKGSRSALPGSSREDKGSGLKQGHITFFSVVCDAKLQKLLLYLFAS